MHNLFTIVLLLIIALLAARLYATPEPQTTVRVEYVVGDGVLYEAVPVASIEANP